MKQILLAYDGSYFAESAIGELPRMGLAEDATILVLVVVPAGASPEDLDNAEKQSEHAVQTIRSLLPQIQTDRRIVGGEAADVILRIAASHHSDLIIIGAHSKSALERIFFGSVSTKVAEQAPCSVRICRAHREPGFQHLRLTLAIDGSEESEIATAKTVSRPWPAGTGIQVITVADPKAGGFNPTLQDKVTMLAGQLKVAGYHATATFLEGDPAKALLKHSETWAPHCILIGSRGLEHGETRQLGTLATELVKHSGCHVEVIR